MHIEGIEKLQHISRDLKSHALRIWGGGRVSWDKVREWHGHIYTTKRKMDS